MGVFSRPIRTRKGELMNMWHLAAQASSVEAAGKFGAKFLGFWIIVLLILAAIVTVPVLLIRRSRSRRERAAK
jgi:hypothetical protein